MNTEDGWFEKCGHMDTHQQRWAQQNAVSNLIVAAVFMKSGIVSEKREGHVMCEAVCWGWFFFFFLFLLLLESVLLLSLQVRHHCDRNLILQLWERTRAKEN